MYNFQQTPDYISVQPYLTQYRKYNILWLIFAILLPVFYFIDIPVKYKYIYYSIVGIAIPWFLFDYFIKSKIRIIFDLHQQTIRKKIPFLFTVKLLSFQEACITTSTIPEGTCYAVTYKNNRFGKYYPVSDYFGTHRSDQEKQQQFETEILPCIESVLIAGLPNIKIYKL